jgi:bifunctional DNA-binding transcriptional regulator/antitoxin component of YhaV-PrlF toxin-antitoxin module
MAISTMTSKHQTTVPKEIREKLRLEPGAVLTWELEGKEVRITAERPAFFALRGSIRVGKGSVVGDIRRARRLRGRTKW